MWKLKTEDEAGEILRWSRFFKWVTKSTAVKRKVGVINRGCGFTLGVRHLVSNPQKIGNDLWMFQSKICSGCAAGGSKHAAIKKGNKKVLMESLRNAPYCVFLTDPIVIRYKGLLKSGDIISLGTSD